MNRDSLSITSFGFDWGNISVKRVAYIESSGSRILSIEVPSSGITLEVHVSAGGRSVRLFETKRGREDGPREMKVRVTGSHETLPARGR
jgi:hypothetical protein